MKQYNILQKKCYVIESNLYSVFPHWIDQYAIHVTTSHEKTKIFIPIYGPPNMSKVIYSSFKHIFKNQVENYFL